MSTRCIVAITYNRKTVELYHHCDGYPEGIGFFLAKCMNRYIKEKETRRIFHDADFLASHWVAGNDFEITFSRHCDIEYYYEFNLDKQTVIGMSVNNWGETMEIYEKFDCLEEYEKNKDKDIYLYEEDVNE